jgi:hypothetical protein
LRSKENPWLGNIKGNWRDVRCPCGSEFHFKGKVEEMFAWERIHLRHMASDFENHEMLSFYPKDMVIIYHSMSGYVIDRRKHRKDEVSELHHARLYGLAKLAGV